MENETRRILDEDGNCLPPVQPDIICDVCGDNMTYKGEVCAGIGFDLPPSEHPEYKKLINMFGRVKFNICIACWIKSLGVKQIINDE